MPIPSPSQNEIALAGSLLDALPNEVALLGPDGTLRLMNRAWRAKTAGRGTVRVGAALDESILICFCRGATTAEQIARDVLAGLHRVLAGEADSYCLPYLARRSGRNHGYRWQIWPATCDCHRGAAVLHEELAAAPDDVPATEEPQVPSPPEPGNRDFGGSDEERLRLVARVSRDILYEHDLVRDVIWHSERHVEVFGEVEGSPRAWWIDHLHPHDRPQVLQSLQQALKSDGNSWMMDYRLRRADGRYAYLIDRAIIVRDPGGRPLRLIGAATDISARKYVENALHESEERFRMAFEEGPLGITFFSASGELLQVNRCFGRMLGYEPAELRGKCFLDITHPDDAVTASACARQVFDGEIPGYTLDKRYVHRNGHPVWSRLTVTALRNRKGKVLYAIGMVEDITERKQVEEALRRAERLASVGTLAAGLAHEINNPLGAIVLSADAALLAKSHPNREEILAASLENIQTAAIRCGRIVKSVLQFARDEVSHKWPGDLADLALHARDVVRKAADEAGVTIRIDIREPLPQLVMNPTEMEQIFVNLIHNAIQASRPGSEILVALEPRSEAVRLVVRDHGRGIPADELPHIFDPFYTTRQKEGGTGLGLSISYGIIHQHGGTIDVQSELGAGTTVEVILPLQVPGSLEDLNGQDPGY